ncbi:hypothetical protein Agub_g10720, partial [Astrephomene gubernaculifera]
MSLNVSDALLKAVQRGRERHSPPIVNKASSRWPTPSPSPPGLVVEELEYYAESGSQGWVPLRIIRPPDQLLEGSSPASPSPSALLSSPVLASPSPPQASPLQRLQPQQPQQQQPQQQVQQSFSDVLGSPGSPSKGLAEEPGPPQPRLLRRPVVIFVHATGQCKDSVRHRQELFARLGYFTAAIDARYHGLRATVPYELAAVLAADGTNQAAAALPPPPSSASPPPPPAAIPSAATIAGCSSCSSVSGGDTNAAAASNVVTAVRNLNPKILSALERADAAAGLTRGAGGGGSGVSSPFGIGSPRLGAPSGTATASATASPSPQASLESRVGQPRAAPAVAMGKHQAAAAARQERALEQARRAHERFVDGWVAAMADFTDRKGRAAAKAVLATAASVAAARVLHTGG